jgi:hypothetical protein
MNSLDLQAARRWRAIAADYDKLAEAFDACPPRDKRSIIPGGSNAARPSRSRCRGAPRSPPCRHGISMLARAHQRRRELPYRESAAANDQETC